MPSNWLPCPGCDLDEISGYKHYCYHHSSTLEERFKEGSDYSTLFYPNAGIEEAGQYVCTANNGLNGGVDSTPGSVFGEILSWTCECME